MRRKVSPNVAVHSLSCAELQTKRMFLKSLAMCHVHIIPIQSCSCSSRFRRRRCLIVMFRKSKASDPCNARRFAELLLNLIIVLSLFWGANQKRRRTTTRRCRMWKVQKEIEQRTRLRHVQTERQQWQAPLSFRMDPAASVRILIPNL
jgi:hypothetical protein